MKHRLFLVMLGVGFDHVDDVCHHLDIICCGEENVFILNGGEIFKDCRCRQGCALLLMVVMASL